MRSFFSAPQIRNRDGGCLTVYWVVISLLVLFLTFERLEVSCKVFIWFA